MKIKFLARPLDWLEKKYTAKSGYDMYLDLSYSKSTLHNKPFDNMRCSDISRNKRYRYFIMSEMLSKYYRDIHDGTVGSFNKWIKDNENSSDTRARRMSFVYRGQKLKEDLAEKFATTDDKFEKFNSVDRYDSLSTKDKKKLLLQILGELAKMKYNSHATEKGKKKLTKFFEKMSVPFASVCEQWHDKNNQQELFNPVKTYPLEHTDWYKAGYKNQQEYDKAQEEYDYDDYCDYCGCSC